MRIVFDENAPRAVAHALRMLAEADAIGSSEPMEILHALDFVVKGTLDVPLIQAVADGAIGRAVVITSDKSMRTRRHERAAFIDTGCFGIVLRGHWSHASLWDRARVSLLWWTTWTAQAQAAPPCSLWQCPWSEKPKPMKPFG